MKLPRHSRNEDEVTVETYSDDDKEFLHAVRDYFEDLYKEGTPLKGRIKKLVEKQITKKRIRRRRNNGRANR